MVQKMPHSNELETNGNILSFPKTGDMVFKEAIRLADSGRKKEALSKGLDLVASGYAHANTLVANIYERGGGGVEQDYEQAFFYYKKAVESVGALHAWLGIARLYMKGWGVERNYEEAYKCYKAIADDANHPVALVNLGRMYKFGWGVAPNLSTAKDFFGRAAQQGSVVGYYELSEICRQSGKYAGFVKWRFMTLFFSTVISFKDPHDIRLAEI